MKYALTSEIQSCRKCGKPLPQAAKCNTLYCDDCLRENRRETWRNARRKSYKKHRQKILKERREEYKWYKERGICVDCHAADAVIRDGVQMTRCAACQERQKTRKKKKA